MDDRTKNQYELVSQEYYKETFEWVMSLIGVASLILCMIVGIIFSQKAFAHWLGDDPLLTYPVAIAISALEIAGVKLATSGIKIDKLTAEQKKYADDYSAGT